MFVFFFEIKGRSAAQEKKVWANKLRDYINTNFMFVSPLRGLKGHNLENT